MHSVVVRIRRESTSKKKMKYYSSILFSRTKHLKPVSQVSTSVVFETGLLRAPTTAVILHKKHSEGVGGRSPETWGLLKDSSLDIINRSQQWL